MSVLVRFAQTFPKVPPGIAVFLLVVVLAAAVYDVRYRRIPNWISVSGVVIGVALNTFLDPVTPGLFRALVGFAVGLGVYVVLYALHAMGAGDAKLMAAVGSLAGLGAWIGIFLLTAIIGGILGLIVIVLRGRIKKTIWNVGYILTEMGHGRPAYISREELDVKSPKSVGLPHGAVIAVGTIFFLALSLRFGS